MALFTNKLNSTKEIHDANYCHLHGLHFKVPFNLIIGCPSNIIYFKFRVTIKHYLFQDLQDCMLIFDPVNESIFLLVTFSVKKKNGTPTHFSTNVRI